LDKSETRSCSKVAAPCPEPFSGKGPVEQMMNTLLYYHPLFLEHETGPHPEEPGRLRAILSHLHERYGDSLELLAPRRAERDDVARLHDPAYLSALERICRGGGGDLDPDTPVSTHSYDAALHAAGALCDGADALMAGAARSALGLVRPPGHHAFAAAAGGFCMINNVAVAARYLQSAHGVERILIVDFDVHHGNGTQDIFYEDGSVFFLSMHRYPFYPGTGSVAETGRGAGREKTLNLPIAFGQRAEEIVETFSEGIEKAAASHDPEMILVSAGFDGYEKDPIGGLGLRPEHYAAIGAALRRVADRQCDGKILSTLEGGYSLSGLPLCVDAYIAGLSE